MATPRYSRIDPLEMSQGEPEYLNRLSHFANTIPDPSLNTATPPDYDLHRQSAASLLTGTTRRPDSLSSPEAYLPPYLDYSDSPIVGLDSSRAYNS
jgi:hypothetical protein